MIGDALNPAPRPATAWLAAGVGAGKAVAGGWPGKREDLARSDWADGGQVQSVLPVERIARSDDQRKVAV